VDSPNDRERLGCVCASVPARERPKPAAFARRGTSGEGLDPRPIVIVASNFAPSETQAQDGSGQ